MPTTTSRWSMVKPATTDAATELRIAIGANADILDVVIPTTATTLPGSPVDGMETDLLVDATNGITWRFRYRSASASTFKWEFVGGPPLYKEIQTQESTSSGAYAALTTAGPSITLPTLPAGGDFDVTIGAQIAIPPSALISTGSVGTATMSYDIGGTGAVDADGAVASIVQGGSGSPAPYSVVRTRRKAALGSATALVAKYKSPGSTEFGYFANRFMLVLPVRVG